MARRLLFANWLRFAILFSSAWLPNFDRPVLAQAPAPAGGAAPAPAPAPGGGVTSVSTQSYLLEYGLVIVMFGAALYSVCRTSRRN